MKTVGLIGGMSWESSAIYYELINKEIKKILGGFHSCKSIMLSVDFSEIEMLQHKEEWQQLDKMMADSAKSLEKAGADFIVLCTNTMHLCANAITNEINIPFLHIAHATGMEISRKKLNKVALLGTRFTMEKDFYNNYLSENFNIEVVIPSKENRDIIHNIIYQELVQGIIEDTSREMYKKIISDLESEGAQGVILGCTEITLLISDSDINIPVFDTTSIHALNAVKLALEK